MMECDACLVIGTSSVVYPAAMFAPALASKGVSVAEFNLEATPATHIFKSVLNTVVLFCLFDIEIDVFIFLLVVL